MNVASIDHSPDAVQTYEDMLVKQLGLNSQESAAIHSAGQTLNGVLKQLRQSSNGIATGKTALSSADLATLANLSAQRNQAISTLSAQIYNAVRPAIAARMAVPQQFASKSVATAANLLQAATTVTATTLGQFQDCIDVQGTASTCVLAPSGTPYVIPFLGSDGVTVRTNLTIARSNVTVMGGGAPGDTVLRRGSSAVTFMMVAASGLTGVTVRDLTFDGNRYLAGLNCLDGNVFYYDLQLSYGSPGTVTAQWLDFINAPGTALELGGGSTVSFSNFGQGTTSATSGPWAQAASRGTAIWVDGSYNGAWYNAIAYAGTAGINLNGNYQYAYGNLLFQNRYELSDGSGGGQIYTAAGTVGNSIAGNVINGNSWPPYGGTTAATGCIVPSGQSNGGTEIYGSGHGLYNNEAEQHTAPGLGIGGQYPTKDITISSNNPWLSSDTPRYIEGNGYYGILIQGPDAHSGFYAVQGVTLDDVLVRNNLQYGVRLDHTTNDGSFTGFANASCISGNALGPVSDDAATLTYLYPTSYTLYRGGTCPSGGTPAQTPAPSGQPGWPW